MLVISHWHVTIKQLTEYNENGNERYLNFIENVSCRPRLTTRVHIFRFCLFLFFTSEPQFRQWNRRPASGWKFWVSDFRVIRASLRVLNSQVSSEWYIYCSAIIRANGIIFHCIFILYKHSSININFWQHL